MQDAAIVRCRIAGQHFPVQELTGTEALSAPFHFSVSIRSTDIFDDPAHWLGAIAQLSLHDSQGSFRSISADIFELEQEGDVVRLSLTSLLNRGSEAVQSRVFMGKTRRDIIDQVLIEIGYGAHQIHWLGQINDTGLTATLVQANESQLAFVQRLLAELGCFFWLDSDGQEEQIYIANELAQTPFAAPLLSIDDTKRQAMAGKDSPLRMSWHVAKPASRFTTHSRPSQPINVAAGMTDDHSQQTFLPLPQSGEQQANRQNQAHAEAVTQQWHLDGCYPTLGCGFSASIPPFWRKDQGSDDLTAIKITHSAQAFDHQNPELGIRYSLNATLIKRSSGYAPKFPTMPDLPNAFPARIESAGRYAYLDERGQYQLRMGFTDNNTERLEHTHASPSVERMVPFANAHQELATGWHFPLLDRSTALVTLLNNDPNRPCVLGFASELGQDGPVTNRNPNQSRIVTPGQNELTLDDELPRILLQTFDGQTKLELNASGAQPFIALAAQYGLISLNAGQQQRWIVQENLIQKHGGAFIEKIKTNNVVNIDGNRHLQAAKQQQARAKLDMNFISEGNQHWQTKTQGMRLRSEGAVTVNSQGAQITKVSDGNYHVQAPNDITITGTGKGDLLFTNGTGGFKIDGKGNIKLFGKQITLKGQSGVSFDGDVEYELGASNEAESTEAVEPVEIDEIEALVSEESTSAAGSPHAYQRETNSYDDAAEEWVDIIVRTASNKILMNQLVVLVHNDGRETLLKTNQEGRIFVKKDKLKGASVRVVGHKMENSNA